MNLFFYESYWLLVYLPGYWLCMCACWAASTFCSLALSPQLMSDSDVKHGLTGPATLREASSESLRYSTELAHYLAASGFFESEESALTRERVLGKLDFLVKKFVDGLSPIPGKMQTGGKIFTFGSYRLGVHGSGADIDALCVVPRHVHRSDFFTTFFSQLESDPNVSEVSKVEDAYVPLIKMRFHDIPVDLTFARLNLPAVKENINLLNDSLLKAMDERCIVSLNGSRATDVMLRLVPNTAVFHGVLRAIKFWAQRRFVYGAAYGYFGGIAFSISVARICQMYPNMSSFDILCRYFETFASWKWPAPVILREVPDLNYNLKVWDPKTYPADRYHRMPVITPVYPQKCATHNVTQSTAAFITAEFVRAHEILSQALRDSNIKDDHKYDIKNKVNKNDIKTKNILKNEIINDIKSDARDEHNSQQVSHKLVSPFMADLLAKLFEYSDFFKRHRFFLEILASAESESLFLLWKGFIESKIRILAMKLEGVENISAAVPFPKAFTKQRAGGDKRMKLGLEVRLYIAIDVLPSKRNEKRLFLDAPIRDYLEFVNGWEKKDETMRVEINAKRKKEVQAFLRTYYDSADQ